MKNRIKSKTDELLRKRLNSAGLEVLESFFLEMNSDGDMTIKGICDVKDYSEHLIFLSAEKYCLEIQGSELFIKVFSLSETVVTGVIENIAFLRK